MLFNCSTTRYYCFSNVQPVYTHSFKIFLKTMLIKNESLYTHAIRVLNQYIPMRFWCPPSTNVPMNFASTNTASICWKKRKYTFHTFQLETPQLLPVAAFLPCHFQCVFLLNAPPEKTLLSFQKLLIVTFAEYLGLHIHVENNANKGM